MRDRTKYNTKIVIEYKPITNGFLVFASFDWREPGIVCSRGLFRDVYVKELKDIGELLKDTL